MPDPTGDNGITPSDQLRHLREQAELINQALAQMAGWRATIDAALEQVRTARAALAADLKQSPPRNLDRDRVDVHAGIDIVQEEGIPLAWGTRHLAPSSARAAWSAQLLAESDGVAALRASA